MEDIILDRLIIRRFHPNDWQDLYEYLSDEEVVKFEPCDIFSEDQAKEEAISRIHKCLNTSQEINCLKR